ncbi:UDP-N-acetylmuramate--L-alanine ligase [Collinsella sp. AGMB00827]|uniref:UDP-N-acetylmuramate--L-alanine ligase n=1 Tax=Collinsella ureilytica TaxID=2869515 RepID=A0ABS7MKL3_9ACTN|nr:UDP-N-acetylmuramate--L-alanine ligase [Collinsella urealyticum]MBY4797909.1 UDP-N-acetylmuramate--L-alanine ligase [Collinsella urealyticum]
MPTTTSSHQTAATCPHTPPQFKKVHFIGIGGAGMSGIALVLHERGFEVSGSDLKTSRYIRRLLAAGIPIRIGHEASAIDEITPDVVVVSTAIPESNPELVRARELGIPVWPRAKMLSVLSCGQTTIAVAGTHGKTTTSSMCATMLDRMSLDPSFLIGGIVEGYETNGRNGNGAYFVCEADESDSSFLFLHPHIAVVTNVEADHLDHYGSLAEIEDTFCEFMSLVGEAGVVVVCGDDARLAELAARTGRRFVTYGFHETNDVIVQAQASAPESASTFELIFPQGEKHTVEIHSNPGRHNMLNAAAALTVAHELGLDTVAAARALSSFEGVRRRFTRIGEIRGVSIVDDYGHHPTEIKATLKAAASLGYEHVCVVFQPHRYSRLEALLDGFADAFADADRLILIDVFPAGEMPIPGVTSKMLADTVAERHPNLTVRYAQDRTELMAAIDELAGAGDVLITMGAGDVTTVGPEYLERAAEMLASDQDTH